MVFKFLENSYILLVSFKVNSSSLFINLHSLTLLKTYYAAVVSFVFYFINTLKVQFGLLYPARYFFLLWLILLSHFINHHIDTDVIMKTWCFTSDFFSSFFLNEQGEMKRTFIEAGREMNWLSEQAGDESHLLSRKQKFLMPPGIMDKKKKENFWITTL